MDLNELQAGSILYLPVFLKGGLIWTGDSHCRQGNGEVNLTALECAYKEIEIQPIVRKDLKTEWPWAETKTDWIFMGYDEDLNQAMKIAVEQTVHWLSVQSIVPMSREEAYALTSIVGDCRVTQVVDESLLAQLHRRDVDGDRRRVEPGPGTSRYLGHTRKDMTTMGEVVGWLVPPAGSTVTPTLSPAASPEASTGAVLPDAGAGSRPAGRIRGGPISHSS